MYLQTSVLTSWMEQQRVSHRSMAKGFDLYFHRRRIKILFLLLLCFVFTYFPAAGELDHPSPPPSSAGGGTNKDGIVQVLENEVWDAPSQSWKASGERWTNEYGKASFSPPEIQPPEGFEFEGDWKIVLKGGDSWEYQFVYLQTPKRRRIWLRTLRRLPPPPPRQLAISKPRPPSSSFSRKLAEIRDDYNFKGFGMSVYKSFVFPSSFGVALRLPLSMNFDYFDRRPGLPSLASSVAVYFPWTIAAFLSTSVHVEWLKWILKSILVFIPRILILGLYQLVLPFIWVVASAALFPVTRKPFPSVPKAPKFTIAKPRYNVELSERVGCSVSYRWSKARGFEWRFGYWHSYLPTLTVYRKLFGIDNTPLDWWRKHTGSLGLSSGFPLPMPPYYSCSACLSLSGLYWKRKGDKIVDDSSAMVTTVEERTVQDQMEEEAIVSSRLIAATKTTESWS